MPRGRLLSEMEVRKIQNLNKNNSGEISGFNNLEDGLIMKFIDQNHIFCYLEELRELIQIQDFLQLVFQHLIEKNKNNLNFN